MIPRIKSIKPTSGFMLNVVFDDGREVLYDVKEDFALPGYQDLETLPGLFESARLDQSRTCVFWSEDIDLPSDTIYEHGRELSQAR